MGQTGMGMQTVPALWRTGRWQRTVSVRVSYAGTNSSRMKINADRRARGLRVRRRSAYSASLE